MLNSDLRSALADFCARTFLRRGMVWLSACIVLWVVGWNGDGLWFDGMRSQAIDLYVLCIHRAIGLDFETSILLFNVL